MNTFEKILTFFKSSIVFRGSYGGCVNLPNPKIDPPSANLVYPNQWNTSFVEIINLCLGLKYILGYPQHSLEKISIKKCANCHLFQHQVHFKNYFVIINRRFFLHRRISYFLKFTDEHYFSSKAKFYKHRDYINLISFLCTALFYLRCSTKAQGF